MSDALVLDRIKQLVAKGDRVVKTYEPDAIVEGLYPDWGLFAEWRSQSIAFLVGLLGESHPYPKRFEAEFQRTVVNDAACDGGLGVLRAVQQDIEAGMLVPIRELLHAEVFDDYLAMADHLINDGGYKDAAAVIAGSTLEGHLRLLCDKNGIPTTVQKSNKTEPKSASAMNDELKQQGVISQIDWRSIQGWLDIRNNAAHGHYDKVLATKVELMIAGIRDFLIRHQA